jgi:hypothetical protein
LSFENDGKEDDMTTQEWRNVEGRGVTLRRQNNRGNGAEGDGERG